MASLTQSLFRRKPAPEMTGVLQERTATMERAAADAQVFLGSRATKILGHSPAPAFVVPRSRAETLAHA